MEIEPKDRRNPLIRRRSLLGYFCLACGISWLLWLPALLARFQGQAAQADNTLLFFLGSFGPLLAALMLTAYSEGVAGVRKLLKYLLKWRVGLIWYAIALYGFLVLGLLTLLVLGISSLQDVLSRLPKALIAVPKNVIAVFLVRGPLGEELGWRGYALPRLEKTRSAWRASLILGVLWSLWHWPLMLIPGWRSDLPIGIFLILYLLYIVPLAVIFTWVYNQTNGSVLITMLLHSAYHYTVFVLDNTFGFSQHDPRAVLGVLCCLFWCVALALVGVFGHDLGLDRSPDTGRGDGIVESSQRKR